MLWTWGFWKDAIERSIRTGAASLAGAIGLNNAPGIPGHLNWPGMLTVAGTAMLVDVLLSISASGLTNSPNASTVKVIGDPKADDNKK